MMAIAYLDTNSVPGLQQLIRSCTASLFNTEKDVLSRHLSVFTEFYFTFFLKDKFYHVADTGNGLTQKWSDRIYNLFTASARTLYFKGDFVLFFVRLKPDAFFSVFEIPRKFLVNAMLPVYNRFENGAGSFTEQLESPKNICEIEPYRDDYFIEKLLHKKRTNYTNTIIRISNIILQNKGIVTINTLAHDANMSLRTFERRFADEVGMSPKRLSRIIRFNNAVNTRILHPQISWARLAQECGYFDQMHMIKEFKEFSSQTPESFFKYSSSEKIFSQATI